HTSDTTRPSCGYAASPNVHHTTGLTPSIGNISPDTHETALCATLGNAAGTIDTVSTIRG
ncbi:hypothetical protein R3Q06_36110, partial [Rhodococcus erythropolis]|uniref:hypothetical protein n=1 Tax=Rhodococcus erythropolis TaxID=1833 RepID=UPI0029494E44